MKSYKWVHHLPQVRKQLPLHISTSKLVEKWPARKTQYGTGCEQSFILPGKTTNVNFCRFGLPTPLDSAPSHFWAIVLALTLLAV